MTQQQQQPAVSHVVEPLPGPSLQLEFPADVPVADQVVVLVCDCCAAGPRLAHALHAQAGSGAAVARHAVRVTGAAVDLAEAPLKPLLRHPGDASTEPAVQLVNVSSAAAPGSSQPQVSILSVNAAVPDGLAAHLVAAIVRWLQARRSLSSGAAAQSKPVVVAGAAVLSSVKNAKGAYLLPIRGGALPAGAPALPTLPDSTKLLNTTLALLSHALFATGIPAALLLVPGNKPSVSTGLSDSVDTVAGLGAALAAAGLLLPGVGAAPEAVAGLELLHRWYAEVQDGGLQVLYT